MKTNLSRKTITGISLIALFTVGCSGGGENSTRPSFQSPSAPRSVPVGGATGSTNPSDDSSGNDSSGDESTTHAGNDTAASAPVDEQATPNELMEAINKSTAAANKATDAANKANSTAKGAQTAGIVAAVLGGLGIAASVGGDYLVNKKSSERDEGMSSSISNVRRNVDRNFEVDVAGHAGTQVGVNQLGNRMSQRFDAQEAAQNHDAQALEEHRAALMKQLAEAREHRAALMSQLAEDRERHAETRTQLAEATAAIAELRTRLDTLSTSAQGSESNAETTTATSEDSKFQSDKDKIVEPILQNQALLNENNENNIDVTTIINEIGSAPNCKP